MRIWRFFFFALSVLSSEPKTKKKTTPNSTCSVHVSSTWNTTKIYKPDVFYLLEHFSNRELVAHSLLFIVNLQDEIDGSAENKNYPQESNCTNLLENISSIWLKFLLNVCIFWPQVKCFKISSPQQLLPPLFFFYAKYDNVVLLRSQKNYCGLCWIKILGFVWSFNHH